MIMKIQAPKITAFMSPGKNLVERRTPERESEHGAENPIHQQPRDEQVEALEGMEADAAIGPKARRSQHHDGDDPAENRDVAEQGSGARADAVHVVDGRRGGEPAGGRRTRHSRRRGSRRIFRIGSSKALRFLIIITLRFRGMFRQYAAHACDTMRTNAYPQIPPRCVLRCCQRLLAAVFATPWAAARPLEIFFIDVEGGQSTLIVSPSGQSLLIDTGWRGFEGRDADRIAAGGQGGQGQADRLSAHHPLPSRPCGRRAATGRSDEDREFPGSRAQHGRLEGHQGRLQRLRQGDPARRAHGGETGRHACRSKASR